MKRCRQVWQSGRRCNCDNGFFLFFIILVRWIVYQLHLHCFLWRICSCFYPFEALNRDVWPVDERNYQFCWGSVPTTTAVSHAIGGLLRERPGPQTQTRCLPSWLRKTASSFPRTQSRQCRQIPHPNVSPSSQTLLTSSTEPWFVDCLSDTAISQLKYYSSLSSFSTFGMTELTGL